MRQTSIVVVSLAAVLACHVVLSAPNRRVPRQAELSDNLDPSTQEELLYLGDGTQDREKRKLEAHTQVKFGAKNAILGFIFGKINGLLDHKTHLVKQLDQFNIQKNKAYNIVSPPTGKVALGQVFSERMDGRSQSVGATAAATSGVAFQAQNTATTTDDTPVFDRAKVSLDIPDELFGSSFSLVTNISKVVGSVIMNSARRTHDFLQLFKPMFGAALTLSDDAKLSNNV